MFDLNWAELMIIAVVALIVIGPDDLPDMFRQLGRFTAKLRQMSREFSRAMEQAAKDTGVKAAADDLKSATSAKSMGLDKVREAADKFEKWDPMKGAKSPTMPARTLTPPPMPATPVPTALAVDDKTEPAEDVAEAAEDVADHGENTIHGPATQALYDKQALRAQVMQEQTAKLRAIEDGTFAGAVAPPDASPVAAPKPARKPGKARLEAVVQAAAEPVADPGPKAKPKRKKAEA